MVNKQMFKSAARTAQQSDAVNEAGGIAYSLPARDALAMLATTGCLAGTFYADAQTQFDSVIQLAEGCGEEFVAKVAVYSRHNGRMKDMPALLLAWLFAKCKGHAGGELTWFERAAPHVLTNGKQVANFLQIVRSGKVGRSGLGARGRRAVAQWLAGLDDGAFVRAQAGFSEPSMADVLRMIHPKPATKSRAALYGWCSGRKVAEPSEKAFKFTVDDLPEGIRQYEAWKGLDPTMRSPESLPDVPWSMLTGHNLSTAEWKSLAGSMSWSSLRQSLNTLMRHGVMKNEAAVDSIAMRLCSRFEILKAKPFPYQIMTTYRFMDDGMPREIIDALHYAMEIATENTPVIPGGVCVFVDGSGSMDSPVTGSRPGATSTVQCREAAGLIAACLARTNPDATVIAFAADAIKMKVEPRDTVMTITNQIANAVHGGTRCSAALALANKLDVRARVCIFVSDNESWLEADGAGGVFPGRVYNSGNVPAQTMEEWIKYKTRVRDAVLVNINLQPYATTQTPARNDIMNVGGFSDEVFRLLEIAAGEGLTATSWVDRIQEVVL